MVVRTAVFVVFFFMATSRICLLLPNTLYYHLQIHSYQPVLQSAYELNDIMPVIQLLGGGGGVQKSLRSQLLLT